MDADGQGKEEKRAPEMWRVSTEVSVGLRAVVGALVVRRASSLVVG